MIFAEIIQKENRVIMVFSRAIGAKKLHGHESCQPNELKC